MRVVRSAGSDGNLSHVSLIDPAFVGDAYQKFILAAHHGEDQASTSKRSWK